MAALAAIGVLALVSVHAAPIYELRYAFTNDVPPGSSDPAFGTRAVAGINDAGDVCGTFMTSNALDDATRVVNSVYLLRTNGAVYDLFPRGVTPAVQDAFANNLTQRRPDGSLQIVGSVKQADGFQRGAIWNVAADGTISSFVVLTNYILPTNSLAPGEQGYGEANAINASGEVVGDGNSYHATKALAWSPPYSDAPGGENWNDSAIALAVDDQETVLVNGDFRKTFTPYSFEGAALVHGGSPTELPPGGTNLFGGNAAEVEAFAMAGSTVVGQAYLGTNGTDGLRPFAWNRGDATLASLSAPAGLAYGEQYCEADSVNTNGDVVGYVDNTNYVTINGGYHSRGGLYTLWKQDASGGLKGWRPYALDSLLPTQPGFSTLGLNSDGTSPANYDIAINDQNEIAIHNYGNRQHGYYDPNEKYYESILVYQPVDTGIVQFFNTNNWYSDSFTEFTGSKSDGAITASVELVRPDGYMAPVTVHFATADGDGTAGHDYIATNGDLVWGFGESGFKNVTVPVVTDNFEYGDRTFYLNLSGANGAKVGMKTATMRIYNTDWETLDFTNTSFPRSDIYDVQAGASNVVITLMREGAFDGTMVITNVVTYDGSAQSGVDFTGLTNTSPVTWSPSQAGSISFSIPLLGNTNLWGPVGFTVEADGTINATNPVQVWGEVDIQPPGRIPQFEIETPPQPSKTGVLRLASYVEQGVTLLLQSSSNLVDWTTVAQVTCTNGVVQFDPSILGNRNSDFYRVAAKRDQ